MIGKELADCWLKIGRAEEHAKTVGDEIRAWEKAKPYVLSCNADPKGEWHIVSATFETPASRDRWSLISGDCIHNLRSALDHLVYAIAIKQTGVNPPTDERILQFPICDNPESFSGQEYRIRSLSHAVRTAIERVQPYNRGHILLPPLLGMIRDFNDRDKHRLLTVAIPRQIKGEGNIDVPSGHHVDKIKYFTGAIKDGAEVMRFAVAPPTLNVQYDLEISFNVGFRHTRSHAGVDFTGIRALLSLLCEEVRTIVNMFASLA